MKSQRSGFAIAELIVACVILACLLTLVGPLSLQSRRLLRATQAQSLVLDELSNQLERLTLLDTADAELAIQSLEINAAVAATLGGGTLSGDWVGSDDERRLRLTFHWPAEINRAPVMLEGWLLASTAGLSETGSDPLLRNQRADEIDSPVKGQTPFQRSPALQSQSPEQAETPE